MFFNLKSSAVVLACLEMAAAQSYFFTFGDSYTQTGFEISGEKASAANPVGNPPIPGYTTTGGTNWIADMVTEFNTSTVLSYNFAYGGATVDASIVAPYEPTVRSFIDQMKIFTDNLAAKPEYAPWTSENTIVGIWLGVNDVGGSWSKPDAFDIGARAISRYFEQVQTLYDTGVRNFALLTTPPIERAPMYIAINQPDAVSAAVDNWNHILTSSADSFKSSHSDVNIKIVDTAVAFNTVLDNPTQYGAPDNTCTNKDGVSCIWWDDLHPAVQLQKVVGSVVAETWGAPFHCVDTVLCSS